MKRNSPRFIKPYFFSQNHTNIPIMINIILNHFAFLGMAACTRTQNGSVWMLLSGFTKSHYCLENIDLH